MGGIERSSPDSRHNKLIVIRFSHDQLRRRRAEGYLNQSSFFLLAQNLREVVRDLQINRIPRDKNVDKIDDAGIELIWSKRTQEHIGSSEGRRSTDYYDTYGQIFIYCSPDGKIRVRGGRFGSTTLSLKKWGESEEIQKKALDKAFKHPRYIFIWNPR